jgi:hypothetical protein
MPYTTPDRVYFVEWQTTHGGNDFIVFWKKPGEEQAMSIHSISIINKAGKIML